MKKLESGNVRCDVTDNLAIYTYRNSYYRDDTYKSSITVWFELHTVIDRDYPFTKKKGKITQKDHVYVSLRFVHLTHQSIEYIHGAGLIGLSCVLK